MNLYEIVMKLNGPVLPVGSHGEDQRRLENIKKLTELVETLLHEIRDAASSAERPEASMRAIGRHARDFLKEIEP